MQPRICPANAPPPMASKASVAPVATMASVRSFGKVAAIELQTCFAPCSRSNCFCCSERTMLTSPIPSSRHRRFSICPRLDAAAVCTRAVWPSRRIVSTMPSAVSGFTKQAAPSAAVVPGGKGRHCAAFTQRYCEYISPASTATVWPRSCRAGSEAPAVTTRPAPSLPTGSDWSNRVAIDFISPAGMLAVTIGRSAVPAWRAVLMSAAPNNNPRSDGLIGAASTRTTTSSGPGCGTGTSASDSSSSPLLLTSDRSCSPVSIASDDIQDLLPGSIQMPPRSSPASTGSAPPNPGGTPFALQRETVATHGRPGEIDRHDEVEE